MTADMTIADMTIADMQVAADTQYARYTRIRQARLEIWSSRYPLPRRYYSLLRREGEVLERIDALSYRICDMRCRVRIAEQGL